MDSDSNPYFQDAGRLVEVLVGLLVLAVALLMGYFGVRGAIMYLHGSRAAPADPVAMVIGLAVGVGGGFTGLRLLVGWREDEALLPTVFLLVAGLGAIAGGIWGETVHRQLRGSSNDGPDSSYLFALVGVLGVVLAWQRWRRGSH